MSERRNRGSEAGDGDKLPWLEPYREPGAPRPRLREVKPAEPATATPKPLPVRRRRAIGSSLGASLGLLAAAALAFGGYWYGRNSVTGSAEPNAIVNPLPPVGAERSVLTYPEIEDSTPPELAAESTEAPTPVAAPRPAARKAPAPSVREPVIRSALNSKPPPPPVAAPPPPKPRVAVAVAPSVTAPRVAAPAPRPAGKPGQTLLLGYYASPRYAEMARRRVVQRYPYLGGLPVVVAPIPLGPGRGSMYSLRLIARSKGDARALCKNLKGVGYGCTVI